MKYLPGKFNKNIKGFTLVELIVVVGILAILLAVVLVALNPAERFADTNDAARRSDINAILNAVQQSIVDNQGAAGFVPLIETQIGEGAAGVCSPIAAVGGCNVAAATACVNLTANLVTPGYLASLPSDPETGVDGDADGIPDQSRYTIIRASNGVVTVRACDAAEGPILIAR